MQLGGLRDGLIALGDNLIFQRAKIIGIARDRVAVARSD